MLVTCWYEGASIALARAAAHSHSPPAGLLLLLQTENIRIAYIDEIPSGSSQVHFKLFVPLEQYDLGPLKLVGFKVGAPWCSCMCC